MTYCPVCMSWNVVRRHCDDVWHCMDCDWTGPESDLDSGEDGDMPATEGSYDT